MGARLARSVAVAAFAVPLSLAAACGSSDNTSGDTGTDPAASPMSPSATPTTDPASSAPASPSGSPAPAGWASCTTVWKSGAKLPAHYKGCSAGGLAVPAQQLGCESGQFFVLYEDHYWAVRGGTIRHAEKKLANSPAYAADVAVCRG